MTKKRDVLDKRQKRELVNDVLDNDLIDENDLTEDLTEHQRLVLRLKVRGATQVQIAKILNVSQPAVCKTLQRVKERLAASAKELDQNVLIGENLFFYSDLEKDIFDIKDKLKDEPIEQLKAIGQLASTRKDRNKLLMDLGLMARAPKEVNHRVSSTPLIDRYKQTNNLKEVVEIALSPLQDDLEEPEPPMLEVENPAKEDDD